MSASRRDLAVDTWAALLRSHAALVPEMDRHVRDSAGLALAWYDVLLVLSADPDGRLRLGDLADRVVLSRARISRVVDELVAAGLVAKEPNPDDKRSAYAVITKQGRARQRRAAPAYVRQIESLFPKDVSNADLRVVASVLERVLTARQ